MTHLPRQATVPECTPELASLSIYDVLGRIGAQEAPLLLPAIQRHFVWDQKKICELFDSIMQGYPIGTFLFWEIDDDRLSEYAFYEFIRDYSEHSEACNNPTAESPVPRGVTGVLDGQQRLNSLYVALRGSYSHFCGGQGYHKSKKENYLRTELFLNVLFEPDDEGNILYEFRFLEDYETDPEHWKSGELWFPIKNIYRCKTSESIQSEWDSHLVSRQLQEMGEHTKTSQKALSALDLLRRRIHEEALVRYFPITNRPLSDALKIFIRANNGGVRVTDAEMIFSTIVANWREGRDKIEQFNLHLNQTGNGFNFDVSRIMQACLVLSGCPTRLRIESFKAEHVSRIRRAWEGIKSSLKHSAELAHQWGLSGNNAINPNAIIALAVILDAGIHAKNSQGDLRQFMLRSVLCGFYRRPETAFFRLREYVATCLRGGETFELGVLDDYFAEHHGKRLSITSERLEEFVMLPIWDGRSYLLLSLLHPQHALHQQEFDKDHIHPRSGFDNLSAFDLDWERQNRWRDWKDRLPNLQLLQNQLNMHDKRAKPFEEWLGQYRKVPADRALYLQQNDIAPETECSLAFEDFEEFFQARKLRLLGRLKSLLNVEEDEPELMEKY